MDNRAPINTSSEIVLARGSHGEIVRGIQEKLESLGFSPQGIDGDFGRKTQAAIKDFQQVRGLEQTGEVDSITWRELMEIPPPCSRDRCLQLTAAFEGHGFSTARGNFDGAGITWGIIGFTLKHGGISHIILEIHKKTPELVRAAFGGKTDELLQMMRASWSQQLAWADSISLGTNKLRLSKTWREGFERFGEFEEVQILQDRLADEQYYKPALRTARQQKLHSNLGIALCFDIHVQNGGIKERALETIKKEQSEQPVTSERELRIIIANAVADNSRPAYREDVRSRKLTIAAGAGKVHKRMYVLRNWGLQESQSPG